MVRTVSAEERIFEACENAGTPAPIIDYKPNDLWLGFPFSPEYLKAIRQGVDGTPPSKVGEKVGKTSGRIPRKTTQKII